MIKLIDNNSDLYRPDKNNYLKSLEYAKSLTKKTDNPLVFHCFWRVPREFGKKQLTVLKSIIVNHDCSNIEINLWSNIDLSENEYFKQVSKYVKLKIWNIKEEVNNSFLNGKIDFNSISDNLCYLEGDLFRLLVLHKYGGFYIDMDVLILRDMSPLNNYEFLYQWGTSGFNLHEPNITMNGAIMKLDKISNLSIEFLDKLSKSPAIKDTTIWGNLLYSKICDNELMVLPGVWFNSEWGFEGTECNPFKRVEKVELFEGAFTWHWHNKWDDEIEDGSKFDILDKIIEQKFKNI
jgi:hypothetical protein